jgi:hypothetical protein
MRTVRKEEQTRKVYKQLHARCRDWRLTPMRMKSKFPSRCRECGGPIGSSEDIDYTKQTGARHLACVPKVADSLLFDAPTIQDLDRWLKERGWRPDTREELDR